MKRNNTGNALTTVKSNLFQLNRAELEAVADLVAGLLQTLDDAQVETVEAVAPSTTPAPTNGKGKARGHIDHKMINGCGPYAYLRYWSGKTLKSQYIGKVEVSK